MRDPGTEPLPMISGDVVELTKMIYAEREAHAAEVAELHARLRTAKADLDRKDRTIIALEELRRQTEYVHSERIKEKEIIAYDTGKQLEEALVALATAKAEGAAEAYEAEAETHDKLYAVAMNIQDRSEHKRLAIEAHARAAAIRKGIETKEGK